MRVEIVPATRIPRVPAWSVVIVVVWGALVLTLAWMDAVRGGSTPLCLFHRVTGLPCATCGGTRATFALARGDVIEAFAMNPLVALALPLVLGCVVFRAASARTVRANLSSGQHRLVWAALLLAVAANWAYLIAHGI